MATAGQALCLALYTSHALLRMPLLVDPTGSTLPHFLTTLKYKECQCLCKGGPGPELHSTAGGRALRTVEAEEGKQGKDGGEEHGTRFTNPCKGAGRAGGEGGVYSTKMEMKWGQQKLGGEMVNCRSPLITQDCSNWQSETDLGREREARP